jgi:hypothetical protein
VEQRDTIRKHLAGDAGELSRREELLNAIVDAFESRGPEAVASELKSRLDALGRAVNEKLTALNGLLS